MQRLNWRILGSALALVCTLASFSTVLNTSVAAATPRGESTYLQADPQKQDDARWISEPTVSSVAVDVGIPDAISEFVVEHWIQLLRLQGEDASRTRVALVAFAEREAIEVPKIFGRATLLAQSLALGPAQHPTPEFTASFELLLREKARAMGRLAALEEELFAALSTESDDAGEASVGDLLRQYRRRILAMTYSCDLRMARVDLREVALALEAAALLKPLDVPAWSSVWLGYDLELAALHEQRVRSQMRCMVEDQKYHQSTGYDSQLLTQRRTAGIERQLRPERAIIAANRHWTEHLCGMLSPDSAVAFRDSVDSCESRRRGGEGSQAHRVNARRNREPPRGTRKGGEARGSGRNETRSVRGAGDHRAQPPRKARNGTCRTRRRALHDREEGDRCAARPAETDRQ
jgi:hypothetical protein